MRFTKAMMFVTMLWLCLFFTAQAHAQVIHDANQVTVQWDGVTHFVDGNPIPTEDLVYYTIDVKNVTTGDIVRSWSTNETEIVLTFDTSGTFALGIKAVREWVDASGVTISTPSPICWSNEEGAPCIGDGGTFVIRHVGVPNNVQNFGIK